MVSSSSMTKEAIWDTWFSSSNRPTYQNPFLQSQLTFDLLTQKHSFEEKMLRIFTLSLSLEALFEYVFTFIYNVVFK